MLVVDIGGGTMHVVLVRLSRGAPWAGRPRCWPSRPAGRGQRGRRLGAGRSASDMGYTLDERADDEHATVAPADAGRGLPGEGGGLLRDDRRAAPAAAGPARPLRGPGRDRVTFSRDRLKEVLETNGFFRGPGGAWIAVLERAGEGRPGRRRPAGGRLHPAARRLRRWSSASSGGGYAPGSPSKRWPTGRPASPPTAWAPRFHRPRLRLRHPRPQTGQPRHTVIAPRARASPRRPTSGSARWCPPARSASRSPSSSS